MRDIRIDYGKDMEFTPGQQGDGSGGLGTIGEM